jgi:hypothetical protein
MVRPGSAGAFCSGLRRCVRKRRRPPGCSPGAFSLRTYPRAAMRLWLVPRSQPSALTRLGGSRLRAAAYEGSCDSFGAEARQARSVAAMSPVQGVQGQQLCHNLHNLVHFVTDEAWPRRPQPGRSPRREPPARSSKSIPASPACRGPDKAGPAASSLPLAVQPPRRGAEDALAVVSAALGPAGTPLCSSVPAATRSDRRPLLDHPRNEAVRAASLAIADVWP